MVLDSASEQRSSATTKVKAKRAPAAKVVGESGPIPGVNSQDNMANSTITLEWSRIEEGEKSSKTFKKQGDKLLAWILEVIPGAISDHVFEGWTKFNKENNIQP